MLEEKRGIREEKEVKEEKELGFFDVRILDGKASLSKSPSRSRASGSGHHHNKLKLPPAGGGKPITRSSLSFAKQLVENFGNEDYYQEDSSNSANSNILGNALSPKLIELDLYLDRLGSSENSEKSSLLALPDEAIWNIMLFLPVSNVVTVGQTSRSTRQVCLKNEVLWEQLLKRDFDVQGNPNINKDNRPSTLYSSVYSRSMRARKNRITKLANRKAQEDKSTTQERIKSWYDWLHAKFVPLSASALCLLGFILLALYLDDNSSGNNLPAGVFVPWFILVTGFWLATGSFVFVKRYRDWWQFALLKEFDGPGLLNVFWEDAFRCGTRAVVGMSGFWICVTIFCVLLFVKLHSSSSSESLSFAEVFIPIWLGVGFLMVCPRHFWGQGRIYLFYWSLLFIPLLISSILLVIFLDNDSLHLWIVMLPTFIVEGAILVLIIAAFVLTLLEIMNAKWQNIAVVLAVFLALIGPIFAFQIMLCIKIDSTNSSLNYVKVFSPLFAWQGLILLLCIMNLSLKS
jgi:hypothetical protein